MDDVRHEMDIGEGKLGELVLSHYEGMPYRSEPEESEDAPNVLAAVNGLLSEAADLLAESHAPTEEEDEAEREILHHISKAGMILAREQKR